MGNFPEETEQWYRNKHIEMWQWVVDNVSKATMHMPVYFLKEQWPGWKDIPEKSRASMEYHCFACGWGNVNSPTEDNCEGCPIKWEGIAPHYDPDENDEYVEPCCLPEALYSKCRKADSVKDRKMYAELIRDAWRPVATPEIPMCQFTKMRVWNKVLPEEISESYVMGVSPSKTLLGISPNDYRLTIQGDLMEEGVTEWDDGEVIDGTE